MFFHMTHIGSPCMRAADTRRPRRQEASDAQAGSCREQKAAAGGKLPSTRQTSAAAAARIYAKRAARLIQIMTVGASRTSRRVRDGCPRR